MLNGAMPADICFAVPLHTSFSQKFQRVTAASGPRHTISGPNLP